MSRDWSTFLKARSWRWGATHVFLLLSIVSSVTLTFLIPPFQGPDETAHFFRVLSLADGSLFPAGGSGDVVPAAALALAADFAPLAGHESAKTSLHEIRAETHRRDEGRRIYQSFPNAAIFSPVPYFGAVGGVVAARRASSSPVVWLWCARIACSLLATVLTAAGIHAAEESGWLLLLLAATPMGIFLRAVCTADSLSIAAAFLFVGLVARECARGPDTRGRTWIVLSVLLLALCKPPYAAISVLVLFIPSMRADRRPRTGFLCAVLAAAACGTAVAGWFAYRTGGVVRAGTDPREQIRFVLRHPLRAGGVVLQDSLDHGVRYLGHLVGRLGWLDAPVPTVFVATYLLVVAVVFFRLFYPPVGLNVRRMVLLTITIAALCGLVSLSVYVLWNATGSAQIDGMQGRYFLPIAPAVVLFAVPQERLDYRFARLTVWAAIGSLMMTIWVVLHRYYL